MPLGSASQVGIASAKPSGSSLARTRSSSAAPCGLAVFHASNLSSHALRCIALRSTRAARTVASTLSSTSKVCSGSNPSVSFRPVTSSSPSAAPCALPVPWAPGEGQAMTVRSMMNVGLSVTLRPASIAAMSASTSST